MKRNRYPGTCTACREQVEADAGFLTPDGLRHMQCRAPGRPARPTLSQRISIGRARHDADDEKWRAANERRAAIKTIEFLFLLPRC